MKDALEMACGPQPSEEGAKAYHVTKDLKVWERGYRHYLRRVSDTNGEQRTFKVTLDEEDFGLLLWDLQDRASGPYTCIEDLLEAARAIKPSGG